MTSPVRQAGTILFLAGAAGFAIWAGVEMNATQQREAEAATTKGFANVDQMKTAERSGIATGDAWRAKLAEEAAQRKAIADAPFVATPQNKYAWSADKLPMDWPKFTKLPNEPALPAKTTAAKIELAANLIQQWNLYKASSSKNSPTSKDADTAIKYLLSIPRNDPAFPQAWATFISLKQVDESIADEKTRAALREEEKKAAKQRGVSVGMTAQQVLDSSWGKPQKVNVTITAGGKREQWVYSGFQFLYLENGVLTSIQTNR